MSRTAKIPHKHLDPDCPSILRRNLLNRFQIIFALLFVLKYKTTYFRNQTKNLEKNLKFNNLVKIFLLTVLIDWFSNLRLKEKEKDKWDLKYCHVSFWLEQQYFVESTLRRIKLKYPQLSDLVSEALRLVSEVGK